MGKRFDCGCCVERYENSRLSVSLPNARSRRRNSPSQTFSPATACAGSFCTALSRPPRAFCFSTPPPPPTGYPITRSKTPTAPRDLAGWPNPRRGSIGFMAAVVWARRVHPLSRSLMRFDLDEFEGAVGARIRRRAAPHCREAVLFAARSRRVPLSRTQSPSVISVGERKSI
jgi:hypothetical protein